MRIIYHLGAHCTDEERLITCLWKNRAVLGQQGIVVPAPTRYRTLLRDTAMTLIDAEVNRQAAMIAYVDDFWLMMWITLAAAPLAFLMRGSTRPAGPITLSE